MHPPIQVDYSEAVMEEIRAAAVDGVCSFAGGGVEVGGVLFGSVEDGAVHIRAVRRIECSHTRGPSFTLENAGEPAIREALAAEAGIAVGWYHSHTRSDLTLSAHDAELHERFFPEPWQVTLLVRPEPFGTAEAAFFTRQGDGSLTQSPAGTFTLHPPPGRARRARNGDTEDTASGDAGVARAAPELHAESRRFSWEWLAVVAAVVLLAIAAWILAVLRAPDMRPLALQVSDESGELYIKWDSHTTTVHRASRAVLEIDDGGTLVSLPLTPERLRSGSVTYARRTDDIEVRMKVEGPVAARESVRIVGLTAPVVSARVEPPPAPAVPSGKIEPTPAQAQSRGEPEKSKAPETAKPRPRTDVQDAANRSRQPQGVERRIEIPERIAAAPPRPQRQFASVPQERSTTSALPQPPQVAARAITPQQAPVAPIQPAQPPPRYAPREQPGRAAEPQYRGPISGRLIWVGGLERGDRLSISGSQSSAGFVNGELPGVPVRVSVHPAELAGGRLRIFASSPEGAQAPREPASANNGWNDTNFVWDSRQLDSVIVTDVPSPANGWKGISIRGNRGRIPVVVIEWRAIPAAK